MNFEETYILQAQSSSGGFYTVAFYFKDGKVRVECDCAAGGFFQHCKHKEALLIGDESILFNADQSSLCRQIVEKVGSTSFQIEFQNFRDGLADIESKKNELNKQAKQLKAAFARKLKEGI